VPLSLSLGVIDAQQLLNGRGMDQAAIFAPFVGTMLLTFVVWFYMYARRIPFVLSRKLSPQEMTRLELERLSPPQVANPSDNLKNLFELPIIFYAVVLYLYATTQVDTFYLAAAWTDLPDFLGPLLSRAWPAVMPVWAVG
jgi:hypothetical protein